MRIKVDNFAQIRQADIDLSDLTVLVGSQAMGKSLLLQLLKLALDKNAISTKMWSANIIWQDENEFLDLYLGEGMHAGWTSNTSVSIDGENLSLRGLHKLGMLKKERLFFMPAHRGMLFSHGFPKRMGEFDSDTPVVARIFSDTLHGLMARRGPERRELFPVPFQLKKDIRIRLAEAIFPGGGVVFLEKHEQRRRLVLEPVKGVTSIPFMTWSAGQREFTPLLLGLGHVLPSAGIKRQGPIEVVVIEEPEMGLHAKALDAFMLAVLDLLHRKYRVIITTHSPMILDLVWGIRNLISHGAEPKTLLNIFGGKMRFDMEPIAKSALIRSYRVYAMVQGKEGVESRNISDLDPGARDHVMASWGGLTDLSRRISDTVASSAIDSECNKRSVAEA